MKPELIRILFVTDSLDKERRTDVLVKKIHESWKLNGNIFVELFLGDLDEKKMTSTGYRRKRNKKESETMRRPDNLFCVPMNHKTNMCSGSTIDKETVILSVFPKQSRRRNNIMWERYDSLITETNIFCGNRYIKQNHKVKPKKLLCQVKTETNEVNLWTQQI